MKISNICGNQPILNTNLSINAPISFSGLKNPTTKCMFVFDLDGSFAHGTKDELSKIVEIAKQRVANLIYATGRNKKEVEKLQQKLADKGITLPTPDYLVCNNGQFLYENIDGVLVKSTQYETQLKVKTNFDSKKVLEAMTGLAHSDKYKFSTSELQRLEGLDNYQQIRESDPSFYTSKISHYKWNASELMSEYFVASEVPLEKLKTDIQAELAKIGIKTKFIENRYSKPIMDACNESILFQSHNLRRHSDGAMTALFLCPADKADGVKYLKRQSGVSYKEILMAGNDDNDVSMAQLSQKGAHFICLNNSSDKLKQIYNSLSSFVNTLFMSKNDGAKGILEVLSDIMR